MPAELRSSSEEVTAMKVMHRRTFMALASSSAAGLAGLGWSSRALASNTGVPTTALDFMSSSQRSDVLAYTGILDVTTPVQQAITEANSSRRELVFPAGLYRITSPLTFTNSFARVRGEGQVIIFQSGANGPVVKIGPSSGRIEALSFSNLVLKGHTAQLTQTTNGIEISATHRSSFNDIRVIDCAASAFLLDWVVSNEFRNLKCTNNVDPTFALSPTYGIRIIGNSTANIFVNSVMEAPISNTAYYIEDGDLNLFEGCAAEGVPYGAALYSASVNNTFTNCDFESNSNADVEINGSSFNTFTGCSANSSASQCVTINGTAKGNSFNGGQIRKVVLAGTSINTKFFGCDVPSGISGGGSYTVY